MIKREDGGNCITFVLHGEGCKLILIKDDKPAGERGRNVLVDAVRGTLNLYRTPPLRGIYMSY